MNISSDYYRHICSVQALVLSDCSVDIRVLFRVPTGHGKTGKSQGIEWSWKGQGKIFFWKSQGK